MVKIEKIYNSTKLEIVQNLIFECGTNMKKLKGHIHWSKKIDIKFLNEEFLKKDIYLLKCGDIYVGTFMVSEEPSNFFYDDQKEKYIYLSKLAIHPNYSNRGLGKKCIKKCREIAILKNKIGIRLDVYIESKDAINFYKKNKFIEKHISKTTNFKVLCMENKI